MKRITKASKKHIELFCKAWNEGFITLTKEEVEAGRPKDTYDYIVPPKTKDHEKTKKQD